MVFMNADERQWRILIEIPKDQCPFLYYPSNINGCKDPKNKSGECNWSKCQYRVGGC